MLGHSGTVAAAQLDVALVSGRDLGAGARAAAGAGTPRAFVEIEVALDSGTTLSEHPGLRASLTRRSGTAVRRAG